MKAVPLDPKLVRDDLDWQLYEATPEYRRYAADDGNGNMVIKTEYLGDEALLEQNRQAYNDSYGQRFGDGKVVASIPLNVYFRTIAPRLAEGDLDYVKWFLNSEQGRPYRSFRGKV